MTGASSLQIRERMSDLAAARDELLVMWQNKQRTLQTQLDVQTFYRDVQQADAMNSGIEVSFHAIETYRKLG